MRPLAGSPPLSAPGEASTSGVNNIRKVTESRSKGDLGDTQFRRHNLYVHKDRVGYMNR